MTANGSEIRIVPAAIEYLESWRECLDSVARERKWLGMVQALPLEPMREFWQKMIADDAPCCIALDGQRVVGWADIKPLKADGSTHRAELGMGVHRGYRGRGVGTRLLKAALDKARRIGLIRVELGVYDSNPAAIALYRKFGFVEEGRLVKGRYLDGRFDDVVRMAMIFEENLPQIVRID